MMNSYSFVSLFDLNFARVTLPEAVDMMHTAASTGEKSLVVTPNVDQVVNLEKNSQVKKIFTNAKYVFVDGMPLVWFSRLLPPAYRLPERVNGTNLMLETCAMAAREGFSIALVGGKEGAAAAACQRLQQEFPGIRIAGYYCPPFGFEKDETENRKLVELVNAWKPVFLFVGVGNPKQELWITNNWNDLNFNVAMGIGSAIELIAGMVKRAPVWMQKGGLEWFFRLMQEPGRLWKRYFVQDAKFIPIAWREYSKIRRGRH